MKLSKIRYVFAASLIVLLMFGSVAYSYAISVNKTELVKHVTLDVFANDALLIEIPANKIGFHTFVYRLNAGIRKEIKPVAHAPPNNNTLCN